MLATYVYYHCNICDGCDHLRRHFKVVLGIVKTGISLASKLLKSLYGQKQSPNQWHERFDRTFTYVGLVVNEADKCVYYRYGGIEGMILCLYVNDILIFGTSLDVIMGDKDFYPIILR